MPPSDTLQDIGFPETDAYREYESFSAAMGAYAHYSSQVGKPELCAWNPWQRFGSLIRGAYPDTAPAGELFVPRMLELKLRFIHEVYGAEDGEALVVDAFRAYKRRLSDPLRAASPPPPPSGVPGSGGGSIPSPPAGPPTVGGSIPPGDRSGAVSGPHAAAGAGGAAHRAEPSMAGDGVAPLGTAAGSRDTSGRAEGPGAGTGLLGARRRRN